jgi:formylmethanofuran dehydrogenase subunit D
MRSENKINQNYFNCAALLKINPSNIQHIINPDESVQIAAVRYDGLVIQYIKYPSETV